MAAVPSAKSLGKRRAFGDDTSLSHPSRRPAPVFSPTSFRYSTPLLAHSSCINALAISNGNGSLLASGGDDRVVQLWRLGNLTGDEKPVARYRGARVSSPVLRRIRGGRSGCSVEPGLSPRSTPRSLSASHCPTEALTLSSDLTGQHLQHLILVRQ